jgi:predicted nucleotidyltransferase
MRVFTFEEILNNRVPLMESFDAIVALIRGRFESSPDIVGAMIIGSVIRRDHRPDSDIDVIAVHAAGRRESAVALFQEISREAKRLHVPVGFIFLGMERARTPHHHVTVALLEHGRMCADFGGVIGRNPVELIALNRSTFVSDTYSYLMHKMGSFGSREAAISSLPEESFARFLGKALSFPVYLARQMIRCICEEPSVDDSKAQVFRQYSEMFPDPRGLEILRETERFIREYREVVRLHLERPDESTYRAMLARLGKAVPLAYEFAEINLDHLVHRFGL